MRIEKSVTSVSWIPSETVKGYMKLGFSSKVVHYDQPLPDRIDDLEAMRKADKFRFANNLKAWIEVENGEIKEFGYSGGGLIGDTTTKLGPAKVTWKGVAMPDLRLEPEIGSSWVRFVQTTGGRTGAGGSMPRPIRAWPFFERGMPVVWTTMALTIHADGRHEHELIGASPFPRHWIYDNEGRLAQKVGLASFGTWWKTIYRQRTPWGGQDRPALVSDAESPLERLVSGQIMGAHCKPSIFELKEGEYLTQQDEPGHGMHLVLDGLLDVEVDGKVVGRLGPGVIVGERAHMEGGRRTASLRAATPARVALTDPQLFSRDILEAIAEQHRREDGATADPDDAKERQEPAPHG